jgi:hypothetical protein
LNWTLANLPPLPGAATRPTLQLPQPQQEYLDQAAQAYDQVLQKYPKQSLAVVSAHFGLAAIAENRGDWDTARQQYEAVTKLKEASQAFRDQASTRLNELDKLKAPVLLAPATEPTTQASTPTTQASESAPTTRVTAPASKPATTRP